MLMADEPWGDYGIDQEDTQQCLAAEHEANWWPADEAASVAAAEHIEDDPVEAGQGDRGSRMFCEKCKTHRRRSRRMRMSSQDPVRTQALLALQTPLRECEPCKLGAKSARASSGPASLAGPASEVAESCCAMMGSNLRAWLCLAQGSLAGSSGRRKDASASSQRTSTFIDTPPAERLYFLTFYEIATRHLCPKCRRVE